MPLQQGVHLLAVQARVSEDIRFYLGVRWQVGGDVLLHQQLNGLCHALCYLTLQGSTAFA